MSTLLVATAGIIGCGMVLKFTVYVLSPKPLGYDVKRVRELENEIWGYYFTPLPEGEKPKPKPIPPKGDGGVGVSPRLKYADNPRREFFCAHCDKAMVTRHPDRNTCQTCTLEIIHQRREEREEKARAMREYHAQRRESEQYKQQIQTGDVVINSYGITADKIWVTPLTFRQPL